MRAARLKQPETFSDTCEADLCAGCKHGIHVAFANALRREWACGKGIFTLTEKRFSGRVLACQLHEPAEGSLH